MTRARCFRAAPARPGRHGAPGREKEEVAQVAPSLTDRITLVQGENPATCSWGDVMEFSADGNLLARILLTLAALGYGVVTIKADFNATHATNRNGRRMHASTWCGRSRAMRA
jgi:hypothetical protein